VPAWRPLAGLIRSLSALLGRDPSQSCRPRFSTPDRHRMCPPTLGLEVGYGCSQISWTTSSVSTRTEILHALAVVQVLSGAVVMETTVAASSDGYAQALKLAQAHAPGRRAFAVEGTGSFGAGLTRFLTGRGERVLEVSRLRRERRSGGKTDALDALRAASSVLAQERPATPRAGGERQALQALVAAREGAVNAKCLGLGQLRDLLVTTPEPLRSELRPLTPAPAAATPRNNSTRPSTRSRTPRHDARAALDRQTRPAADCRGA
jgi:transposase